LMRLRGLQGARRGKAVRTTVPDPKAACPRDRVTRVRHQTPVLGDFPVTDSMNSTS
jgi:hypothetical protein